MKIIDDFLPSHEFEEVRDNIIGGVRNGSLSSLGSTWNSTGAPFYLLNTVAYDHEEQHPWCWYAQHVVFNEGFGESHLYNPLHSIFIPKFDLKALIRIKINFYPHTEIVKEHPPHHDYDFNHRAAVFSLNTCDGFTRLEDGTKIDSVANRIVFFDGSQEHNSSTTSTTYGRYNINFNFL